MRRPLLILGAGPYLLLLSVHDVVLLEQRETSVQDPNRHRSSVRWRATGSRPALSPKPWASRSIAAGPRSTTKRMDPQLRSQLQAATGKPARTPLHQAASRWSTACGRTSPS